MFETKSTTKKKTQRKQLNLIKLTLKQKGHVHCCQRIRGPVLVPKSRIAMVSFQCQTTKTKKHLQPLWLIWLVVSTHLKHISQNGNLPQIGVKIKNVWNHHLVYDVWYCSVVVLSHLLLMYYSSHPSFCGFLCPLKPKEISPIFCWPCISLVWGSGRALALHLGRCFLYLPPENQSQVIQDWIYTIYPFPDAQCMVYLPTFTINFSQM